MERLFDIKISVKNKKEITRGAYYTQTKEGQNYFRFDFRFGKLVLIASESEVTLRAQRWNGKTIQMARAVWENGKLRTVSRIKDDEGNTKFMSGPSIFCYANLVKPLGYKGDYANKASVIRDYICSALGYMLLAQQPWRIKEYAFVEAFEYHACSIKTDKYQSFNRQSAGCRAFRCYCESDYLSALWFPARPFGKAEVTNKSKDGYSALRYPSVKQIASHIFGEKGKVAVQTVNDLLSQSLDTGSVNLIKKARKAGWTVEQIQEHLKFFRGTCLGFEELLNYQPTRVQKLIKTNSVHWVLNDSVNMLSQVNKYNRDVKFPITKEIKNLAHLHDALSWVINHCGSTDYKLWKHPEFSEFEGKEVSGYTIHFPEWESELKTWGSSLGICVGGYGQNVHDGQSIVFGLMKDSVINVCCEISGKSHKLIQVYGKQNYAQPKELAEALCRLFGVDGELTVKDPEEVQIGFMRGLNARINNAQKKEYKALTNKKPMEAAELELSSEKVQALFKQGIYETKSAGFSGTANAQRDVVDPDYNNIAF